MNSGRQVTSYVVGHCPVGCGQTLALVSNEVVCSEPDCPRPRASTEILLDSETEHVVQLERTEFTVRHPLRERLDDALLVCDLHHSIAAMNGPPAEPGLYRVSAEVIDPTSHSRRGDSTGYTWLRIGHVPG